MDEWMNVLELFKLVNAITTLGMHIMKRRGDIALLEVRESVREIQEKYTE